MTDDQPSAAQGAEPVAYLYTWPNYSRRIYWERRPVRKAGDVKVEALYSEATLAEMTDQPRAAQGPTLLETALRADLESARAAVSVLERDKENLVVMLIRLMRKLPEDDPQRIQAKGLLGRVDSPSNRSPLRAEGERWGMKEARP